MNGLSWTGLARVGEMRAGEAEGVEIDAKKRGVERAPFELLHLRHAAAILSGSSGSPPLTNAMR